MARLLPALGLLFFMTGCGTPVAYPVSGSVTYDGQPVADGTIAFFHDDHPEWGPDAGILKDGAYTITAKPGTVRVVITGNRPVTDPEILRKAGGVPPREDFIPAKHNTASRKTVAIDGPMPALDFALEK